MKIINTINRNSIRRISTYLLFAFSIFNFQFSIAQDTARISLTSRVQKDAILLRWGATTPMSWQQTNRYGFRIERHTILRDKKALPQPEKTILAEPFKAQPLEKWEQIAIADDHAAIIAQALYGESFELTGGDAQGLARIINLSQQLEQRFTMSLYAADRNFEAACMAGWGYRDTNIRPGEKYLYRIVPLVPTTVMVIDTGYVYTGIDQFEPLPQPLELAAVFGDHNVMLTWNYDMMHHVYNNYYVEKSTDGKNFTRLPGLPLANLNNQKGQTAKRMFFSDSIAHNDRAYHYRICGINAFGEIGPPSEIVSGQGRSLLVYVPNITRAIVNDQGAMELEWEFDPQGNTLISGFELNRSDNPNNGFVAVKRNLSPTQRKTEFKELSPANYFTISAIPTEGESTASFPILVQPLDTIPPATPVTLSGTIDTTGIVTLKWDKNRESDLLGYKLYRALRKGDELLPLFDAAFRDTIYCDTVNVHNLNTHVYYAIAAVDMRYNQSRPGEILALRKPMMVAPSSPVISDYQVTEAGIYIAWINSPNEDVTEHRLYRKVKDTPDATRLLLQCFTNQTDQSYTDAATEPGVYYVYTLTAANANGLESQHSPAMTAFTIKKAEQEIARFEVITNKKKHSLKLIWSHNLKDVKAWELYKGTDGQPPTLWKTMPETISEITDEAIQKGDYVYLLRAVYQSGQHSKMKSVTIKW